MEGDWEDEVTCSMARIRQIGTNEKSFVISIDAHGIIFSGKSHNAPKSSSICDVFSDMEGSHAAFLIGCQ